MFSPNSSIPYLLQISLAILLTFFVFLAIYYLIYIGNKHVSDDKQIKIDVRILVKLVAAAAILFLVYILFDRYKILGQLFFSIFISIIIAFIINPAVNKLEEKKLTRGQGTLLVYLSILLIFIVLGFIVVPKIHSEGKKFIVNLPDNFKFLMTKIEDIFNNFKTDNTSINSSIADFENTIQKAIGSFQKGLVSWLTSIFSSIQGGFSKIVGAVLVPIITFYFVVDKDKILKRVNDRIPDKYRDDFLYLYNNINIAMHDIVRGRFIMAIFVGIATMIMLFILRIEFAVVIGEITMIADIIPYFGPFLGFLPALLFALMQSPIKAIWVSVFFVLIQWIENNIVGPKVLGSSTGLHPLVILLSIIVGGGMFGVWGMILAVPIVAIILIIKDFAKQKVKDKKES